MSNRGRALIFALLGIAAQTTIAQADPVTYAGTIAKLEIVVELTDDPAHSDGPVAGRYFYRTQGVDIPLQAVPTKGGTVHLAEEGACEPDCTAGTKPPIAAKWTLSSADDGKTLKGTWAGKKQLAVALTRVGSRASGDSAPTTPYDLYNFSDMEFLPDETPISMEISPYDYLRLDMAPKEGEILGWPDARYRNVTDTRTKVAMPRIVELAGGAPFDAANAVLQDHQWQASRSALACVALKYAGFSEDGTTDSPGGGDLGGYDESTATVDILTPKLMGWTESGSIYCGGAHPENYSHAYTMDIASGAMIGPDQMFADAVDGKAGPSLIAYVKEHRTKPKSQTDIDFETECGMDDLIDNYLDGHLKRQGDAILLVLGIAELPHAIGACEGDLIDVPLEDARPLLKPDFAKLLSN